MQSHLLRVFGWAWVLAWVCWGMPAHALVNLSDATIDEAVKYGLENSEVGLNLFLGPNWREGDQGALLNIYTPYMEIARSAAHRNMTTTPEAEDIAKARGKIVEDIDYVWHHPTIKFMVSMYGASPSFAKNVYAVLEGSGKGRHVVLYPQRSIQQYLAEKEENVKTNPYTAINAYHFKFQEVAPLDEFTLKLYGKGVEPITFFIRAQDIQ